MLVILSDSLCDTDLRAPLSDRVRDAVCNLGLAHHEGRHLISVSHALRKRLCALKELGDRERRAFQRNSWDLDLTNQLRGEVSAYALVHPLGTPARVEIPADPGPRRPIVFQVDLSYFATSLRAQACQLVGEDARDADFYHRLGDAYRTKYRRDTRYAMQGIDGGGGKTGATFHTHARRGITVCVVDTDRTSADAPFKPTAAGVLEHRARLHAEGLIADAHPLPCHELENLLPAQLVLDVAPDGQEGERARLHRDSLGRVDYIDLKPWISKQLHAWVAERPPTAAKLAEYCFSQGSHPYLAELGALLWSWGIAPPEGKARV